MLLCSASCYLCLLLPLPLLFSALPLVASTLVVTGEGKKSRKSPLHITEKRLLWDIFSYRSTTLSKLQNKQKKLNIFGMTKYYWIMFLQKKKTIRKPMCFVICPCSWYIPRQVQAGICLLLHTFTHFLGYSKARYVRAWFFIVPTCRGMLYQEFFDVPRQVKMGKWGCPFFFGESLSPHML